MLLIKPQSKAKIKNLKSNLPVSSAGLRYSQLFFFGSEPLVAQIWLEARRLNLKPIRGHQNNIFFPHQFEQAQNFCTNMFGNEIFFPSLRCHEITSDGSANGFVSWGYPKGEGEVKERKKGWRCAITEKENRQQSLNSAESHKRLLDSKYCHFSSPL